MAQPGPSQVENPWEMCPDSMAPSTSQCMMQATPQARPTSLLQKLLQYEHPENSTWNQLLSNPSPETLSSSEEYLGTDAEEQASEHAFWSPTSPPIIEPLSTPNPPAWNPKPLKQKPLPPSVRALLQWKYEVYPEKVERYLHSIPDGKPTSEGQKQVLDDLRALLHYVPVTPCHLLVCSFSPELQPKLRRLQACTYKIRKAENDWARVEQRRQDRQELLDLRAQVNSLTQANCDLQRQLATYQELQQEIELLRDLLANRLRTDMIL
ncbi:hypothetical protein ABVT39_019444 [Epinephelus coioides]